MLHAARLALAHQTEREILSAIAALDWNADIQKVLGVPERQAIELFLSYQNRRLLVCRPEHPANNFAETGRIAPPARGKWIRPAAG